MEKFQLEFLEYICELMDHEPVNEYEQTFQSVLGIIYTLIEEGKIKEVDKLLKQKYPEYYCKIERNFPKIFEN